MSVFDNLDLTISDLKIARLAVALKVPPGRSGKAASSGGVTTSEPPTTSKDMQDLQGEVEEEGFL